MILYRFDLQLCVTLQCSPVLVCIHPHPKLHSSPPHHPAPSTPPLVVAALVLSLRRQKRDVLSPTEEDEIHENIITYDDEGGGEADTAAFDILALKSAPHSALKGPRLLDSRNM